VDVRARARAQGDRASTHLSPWSNLRKGEPLWLLIQPAVFYKQNG